MSTDELGSTRWPSAGWVIRSTALVVLTVALLQAVANIASVLVLIIIGGFVAVGIEPVASRFEQRGWRRGWVILAFAFSLLAAIAAVASSLRSRSPTSWAG